MKFKTFDTVKYTGTLTCYYPERLLRVRNLLVMVASEVNGVPTKFWPLDSRSEAYLASEEDNKLYVDTVTRIRPYVRIRRKSKWFRKWAKR